MVDTSIGGRRLARELDALIARRGKPVTIVSDNGTEMTSRMILDWSNRTGVGWYYIAPGKPQQNGFCGELQRPVPRRVLERRSVHQPCRGSVGHRALAPRLQPGPAALRTWRADTGSGGSCPRGRSAARSWGLRRPAAPIPNEHQLSIRRALTITAGPKGAGQLVPYVPKPYTSGAKADGRFGKQDFVYLPQQDAYRCPAGQTMKWWFNRVDENGMILRHYWTTKCPECPLKAQCTPAKMRRVTRWRGRCVAFGRSSEKLRGQMEQLELTLADLDELLAETEPKGTAAIDDVVVEPTKPARRPLPSGLPRDVVEHAAPCSATGACVACGGVLRPLGEDVTELLDYVPGSFRVIRHVRPKLSCRSCEAITQAPSPSLPIRRGRAGAGLLAHVLVSKYGDHLPLHRQAEIYAREDIDLSRSTLADMVGQSARLLRPLLDALGRHVMAGERVHADDTVVPVLEPGLGRTRTARLWTYVRDDRPFAGPDPAAVLYRYSPDRKGEHPRAHLASFRGILQADGYAGFAGLYADGRVVEAACLAHARRKFWDVYEATKSPLARQALDRIAALYRIEDTIRNLPPDQRLTARVTHSAPLLTELRDWLEATRSRISGRSELAAAIRYTLARWDALTLVLRDGRACIDNSAAERVMRPIAIGRRNWTFAGSDAGGHRTAAIYSLIETAKIHGLDPQAYLRHVLERIADYPVNRVAGLLPWNTTDLRARLDKRIAA